MTHPLENTNKPQPQTFAEKLGTLTAEVVPKAKESLKGALETAKAILGSLNPFRNELMEGKGIEKKSKGQLVATVAPILLYLFGFKIPETTSAETAAPVTGTTEKAVEMAKSALSLPNIPKEKEGLKTFFIQALAKQESSAKADEKPLDAKNQPRPYFHYANFKTIPVMYEKYKLGSTELFKKGFPANLQEFRKFLVENVPPIAIEDLGKCAIGKYQIIPYWHFVRMGWDWKNVEHIYNFMKDPGEQEDLMANMAEDYYTLCKGDFIAMAICHYAGPNKAKLYLTNPNAAVLTQEQYGGYPSIVSYATAVKANMKSIQGS